MGDWDARGGRAEVDLDPEDWEAFRHLGHRMVDDMVDYLQTIRERPAWRALDPAARTALSTQAPRKGAPLGSVYQAFKDHILPYPTGNQHPRFFGWAMGNGVPSAMLADLLASGMNPHLGGYDQSAALVERQVVAWLAQAMGFPAQRDGLLTSGATLANLNGLIAARRAVAGAEIRAQGHQFGASIPLTLYASAEVHSWLARACEIMGLGRQALRLIPADEDFRISLTAARTAIEADLAAGLKPFCIVASVGTINTGAIDDVAALRALADEFGLWLHVDGAFGTLAALAPEGRARVWDQRLADSLAFDLHKWGYLPFEIACVLVRDPDALTAAFAEAPDYLTPAGRGLTKDLTYFADRGAQMSRGFRALKAWMVFQEFGLDHIGQVIQQNIAQAAYLAELIDAEPELERLAPASLNVVAFRYRRPGAAPDAEDAFNSELTVRLQEGGEAIPSLTRLNGRVALRACFTNHRTRRADVRTFVDLILQAARGLAAEAEGG